MKSLKKAVDLYMTEDKVNEAGSILNELTAINPNTLNVYNGLYSSGCGHCLPWFINLNSSLTISLIFVKWLDTYQYIA